MRDESTVSSIVKPLTYRVKIGDSQTKSYTVVVREKPVVDRRRRERQLPAYLGRPSETPLAKGLDLEAPQFSVAELRMPPLGADCHGSIENMRFDEGGGHVEEGRHADGR